MCSDIREAWAINASNGLQIYAFPEGSKDESATFVNTLKCDGVSERHVRLVIRGLMIEFNLEKRKYGDRCRQRAKRNFQP